METDKAPRTHRSGQLHRTRVGRVTLQRMDNVGIVVESLDAAVSFFAELGLELEGRATNGLNFREARALRRLFRAL